MILGTKQTITENKLPIFEPEFLLDLGQFFQTSGVFTVEQCPVPETPKFYYGKYFVMESFGMRLLLHFN